MNIPDGKKVDQQRLQNMYIEYKKQQIKRKLLKEKVENEEGTTFKPKLLIDETYQPKHNFYERNELLLTEKKLHSQDLLRKLERSETEQSRVHYSPEQREAIRENINQRLYRPAVEKLLAKGNLKENQFTRKINYPHQNNNIMVQNLNFIEDSERPQNDVQQVQPQSYINDLRSDDEAN